MYLFIRKPFDEFVSPWEYGLLPMTTVKKGVTGDHIKVLRQAVNIILGYDALKLTTKFDDSLTKFLKEAQGILGVKKDGVFGKNTYTAMLTYLEEYGFGMENQTYSPDSAMAYAPKHNMKHPGSQKNFLYPYNSNNNCSNFVAQCLVAGGLAITSDFNPYTTGFTLCRYAPKSKVNGLLEHLMSLGYPVYGLDTFTTKGSYASQPVDINKIKPGDVIFCNGSGGMSGHAMLVIDVNTSLNVVYFSANTTNRCGCSSCSNSINVASITTHVAMSEN